MPTSKKSSSSSASSLETYHSDLALCERQGLVKAALLSRDCILPLKSFFCEDLDALAQITTFCAADLTIAYTNSMMIDDKARLVVSQQAKIKHLTLRCLMDKGIESAMTLPDFPRPDDYLRSSCYSITLSPEPMMQTIPTSPSFSDDDTPIPIPPQSQFAVRSLGNPCHERKKRRETISFGVGLSRPINPASPFVEDKEYISNSVQAQSEETFRDRNGVDYSTITCRYCSEEDHRQIKCPKYFCRVCNKHEPRHLSSNCPDLMGKCIITTKPGTYAFHYQLRQWENERDNKADKYKGQFAKDADLDPELYQNCD
ncbi:uncharacterized protein F5891DRAFT_1185821 [Suillus fuscotomentosus]|uniref:CCHC-type domain-containing protein n=1 Tax=Suillus fuscotomentosus TaxID=1912939 RepID=A0AAD4EBM6_9AGAM|nr:uncharacterized protein F5891DRAFT_1185821 [Suillus fuscotomentosus]KAG1903185.1 hypothetical protein F5891DRAFT_1185821 [Suillus fuscotomentosus]